MTEATGQVASSAIDRGESRPAVPERPSLEGPWGKPGKAEF